jgi:glycosyltransferase involved in cell wall biosynthesis
MNVFLIPSWYPSEIQPLAGIFIREQADAIADLCPDFRVVVSTWGHQDGEITVRRPWDAVGALYWWIRQKGDRITRHGNVWEVFHPALSWSRRLPLGGADRLLGVNRRNLKKAIDHFGSIDLIHAHVSYPAGFIAAILSEEFDIPYVVTEHMSPFPFPSLMEGGRPIPEILTALSRAEAVIAVSPSLAERMASFGFPLPLVIPNVVDERHFSPSEPEPRKFVFFTLCLLSEQKGIDHLLKAISLWHPLPDEVEFWIGGGGPLLGKYQAMADALGISDRVKWLGQVSRSSASKLFGRCHAFVLPSRHETFGVVYAEAIACGKPVIATRCGGPEFIVNEGNGLLVDVGDVHSLAETMKTMHACWHRYDPANIRRDFESRFSRAAVVNRLRSLYEQISGKNAHVRPCSARCA